MAGVKGKSGGPRPNSGGARPGSGRKPKKAQPADKPANELPTAATRDPLDFLLGVMQGTVKADAAKQRAPGSGHNPFADLKSLLKGKD